MPDPIHGFLFALKDPAFAKLLLWADAQGCSSGWRHFCAASSVVRYQKSKLQHRVVVRARQLDGKSMLQAADNLLPVSYDTV
jgi:hypothetical protein